MTLAYTLGGRHLAGTAGCVTPSGQRIVKTLTGWWGAPITPALVGKPNADGAYLAADYYDARNLTLVGYVVAGSYDDLRREMAALTADIDCRADTVLVVDEAIPKQVTVRRSGDPKIAFIAPTTATYQLGLVAADPRKYATTPVSASCELPTFGGGIQFPLTFPLNFGVAPAGGQCSVFNGVTPAALRQSTVPVRPVLTLTGPCTNPTVEFSPAATHMTFDLTLGDADTLVVDCEARTIVLNGTTPRRNAVAPTSQWAQLAPGWNTVTYRAYSGAPPASLLVTFSPAWI